MSKQQCTHPAADTIKKHKLLCIVCPEGCEIEVIDRNGELSFSTGICRRGREYSRREIYNPSRVLTTTVPVNGGETPMLPVRTSAPIPKRLLIRAMQQIAVIRVAAPIEIGSHICQDIAGTGITLVACRKIGAERIGTASKARIASTASTTSTVKE